MPIEPSRKRWLSITDPATSVTVLINLDFVTRVLVPAAGVKLIFVFPITGGTGTGSQQALTYANNADALAAFAAVKLHMTETLDIVQEIE